MPAVPLVLSVLAILATACSRDDPNAIEAVGTVEIREHDVAPMTAARVVRLLVDEGAAVDAGDTVAVLSMSTLAADIEQARARLATAQAALREAEAGPRAAEIERAEADLRAAEAEADRASKDLVRIRALTESGALAEQQLDAARTLATTTANRRDALRETLRLLRQGTRPERIAGARAEVATAQAALAAAQATRSDLVLIAPVTGVVLGRHAEAGEVVPPGTPVMTVGESAKPWVRVYVSPGDAARLTVGGPAVATLDDLPEREFPGRIVSVATKAEFTPRVALTENERADLLFAVRVELDDSTGMLKPGLPVTVRMGTRNEDRGSQANGGKP
ncbi:MAG TPA: HlyD family efflux transporter periplasmic adaptor subunit [Gemmatimonadaceae bacterium]|nr:HlyD family efflux transporter periplasmic adaptor subunit [Gemmatimonadaceae bacterium]